MFQESQPKEINFGSNVERAVYEVFNKVCEGLGYDWREYTSDEKYSFFFATILQKTHIDGYPKERKDYILRREVRDLGGIYCKIEIFTPQGQKFTDYDIKRMLAGEEKRDDDFDANKPGTDLDFQEISDEKINEAVKKILEDFANSE